MTAVIPHPSPIAAGPVPPKPEKLAATRPRTFLALATVAWALLYSVLTPGL